MKGMLDFLEKAGLVKNDTPASAISSPELQSSTAQDAVSGAQTASVQPSSGGQPLDLHSIYANHSVALSIYPAERLLRLLDGLNAMDESTRLMAIKAMDEADESWSIQDPLIDAGTKLAVLAEHVDQLQNNLQTLQSQTQSRVDAITSRADQVVGDIRKQISELEALAAREQSRSTQEIEDQQMKLRAARDQTSREVSDISVQRARFEGLTALFQTNPSTSAKD
jgi:hypothetical protein